MTETVEKLDAAKRQLTAAIRLFFDHADPVAIHTLAAAAYQILYDLSKGRSVVGIVKGNPNVRKDKKAEWERILNQAQNFFKHADRDPLGKFDFKPEMTRFFLFDTISLYTQMTNQPFLEGTVYLSWVTVKYDHFLVAGDFKDYIFTMKQKGLDPDDFNFIKLFLQQSAT